MESPGFLLCDHSCRLVSAISSHNSYIRHTQIPQFCDSESRLSIRPSALCPPEGDPNFRDANKLRYLKIYFSLNFEDLHLPVSQYNNSQPGVIATLLSAWKS